MQPTTTPALTCALWGGEDTHISKVNEQHSGLASFHLLDLGSVPETPQGRP